MNETIVTVVGNVASDISTRRVGEVGDLVTSFRVVSHERRRDRATGAWIDGDRFSAKVSCWRRVGEGSLSLTKGDAVVVTGRLSVREYEQNGERKYSTELSATAVGLDLARSSVTVHRRRAGDGPGVEGASAGSVAAVVPVAHALAISSVPAADGPEPDGPEPLATALDEVPGTPSPGDVVEDGTTEGDGHEDVAHALSLVG